MYIELIKIKVSIKTVGKTRSQSFIIQRPIALPGSENIDKSWFFMQICAHCVLDPPVHRCGCWICLDLFPKLRLYTQEWKHETETSFLQDLHHSLFTPIYFCN